MPDKVSPAKATASLRAAPQIINTNEMKEELLLDGHGLMSSGKPIGGNNKVHPTVAESSAEEEDDDEMYNAESLSRKPGTSGGIYIGSMDPLSRDLEKLDVDSDQVLKSMFYLLDENGSSRLTTKDLEIIQNELFIDSPSLQDPKEPQSLDVLNLFQGQESVDIKSFAEKLGPYVVTKVTSTAAPPTKDKSKKLSKRDRRKFEAKVLDGWARWTAESHKFNFNSTFLNLLLFAFCISGLVNSVGQYGTVRVNLPDLVQRSPIFVTVACVVIAYLVVSLAKLDMKSSLKKFRQGFKIYSRLGRGYLVMTILSWSFSLLNIFSTGLLFWPNVEDPYRSIMFSLEVIFPLSTNFFCLFSLALMTVSYVSYEWRLVKKRDLMLLKRDVLYLEGTGIQNGADLCAQILKSYQSRDDTRSILANWKYTALDVMIHIGGMFTFFFTTYMSTYTYSVEILREWSYNRRFFEPYFWQPPGTGLAYDTAYLIICASGAVSLFFSTYIFHKAVYLITDEPFRRNLILMESLMATSDPVKACANGMPYCSFYRRSNLKAFLHISYFLRNHEQDSDMGQASSGFAGLLITDIAIVLYIMIRILWMGNWTGIIVPLYYAAVVTYLAAKLLFRAVKINAIFDEIIEQITKYQSEVALMAENENDKIEGESVDSVYETLERVKSICSAGFKPVTVLGIEATPTLTKVFFGYLLTAGITMIAKYAFGFELPF